ncbi:hypothetical protein D3C78_589930 [compost metagenome]
MIAVHVTGQEAQAIDTDGLEVVVVTQLPGALLGRSEVVDLHIVDQIGVAAIQVRHRVIADHALPAGAEGVAADGISQHAAQGTVVDGPGTGRTAVGTAEHPQIGLQRARRQGLIGQYAQEVLAIDVFQFAILVLSAQAIIEPVLHAVQIEVIGRHVAGVAFVLAVQADVLGVRGVPGGVPVEAGTGKGQVLQLPGGEQRTVEHRRQQATVVVLEQWQVRQQCAVLQYAAGRPDLGGQTELGVLVCGTARVIAG